MDQELSGAVFADERLGKRFRALLEQLSRSPGDSIPRVSGLGEHELSLAQWALLAEGRPWSALPLLKKVTPTRL